MRIQKTHALLIAGWSTPLGAGTPQDQAPSLGADTPWEQTPPEQIPPREQALPRSRHPPPPPPADGYCCGRYASYWNAFLFDLCCSHGPTHQLLLIFLPGHVKVQICSYNMYLRRVTIQVYGCGRFRASSVFETEEPERVVFSECCCMLMTT